MAPRHVIVDGSNLATEGRSMPSLAQLDRAVREFATEHPDDVVTVVVDASFGHRIDPSELPTFEEAEAAGEVISPPAGAIGRGDAFLLRIAEKTGATVLSNDSFQEFHGDHAWLFDKGRLVGGKPVPGVGWIFMDRTPVRGQRSREVVKEAKRRKRGDGAEEAPKPAAAGKSGGGGTPAASKGKARPKSVDRAIASATQEVVEPPADGKSRRRRGGGAPPADPVNEPLAFITFIAAHPLGSEVVGSVVEFSSHGAFVSADGARCYLPLSAMGEPPPRRAREVVSRGDPRTFVVQAFDPQRRGIELALPGFAKVAGGPTEETVEAEIHQEPEAVRGKRRGARKAAPAAGEAEPVAAKAGASTKKASAKKAAARKSAATKAVDKKAEAKKPAARKPAATKPPAGTAAEKAGAKKTPARQAAAAKAAPKTETAAPEAKKAAPKKTTRAAPAATTETPAKANAVKKAATAKAAPTQKARATQKPAPAKKAAGTPAARARGRKAAG